MASNTNRAIHVMAILLAAVVLQSNGQANEAIDTSSTSERIETVATSAPSEKNEPTETTEASDSDLDQLLSEVFYTNSSTGPDTTRVGETDNVSLNEKNKINLRDKIYLKHFFQQI